MNTGRRCWRKICFHRSNTSSRTITSLSINHNSSKRKVSRKECVFLIFFHHSTTVTLKNKQLVSSEMKRYTLMALKSWTVSWGKLMITSWWPRLRQMLWFLLKDYMRCHWLITSDSIWRSSGQISLLMWPKLGGLKRTPKRLHGLQL